VVATSVVTTLATSVPAHASNLTTVLNGTIKTSSGQIDGGVSIWVRAWPNAATLAAMPDGASVPRHSVLRKLSANGAFSVQLDPTVIPAQFKGANGEIELEIAATDGTNELSWSTTVVPATTPGAMTTAMAAAAGSSSADAVQLNMQARSASLASDPAGNFVNDTAGPAYVNPATGDAAGPSMPAPAGSLEVHPTVAAAWDGFLFPDAPAEECVPIASTWHYSQREQFATVYSWSGARATVDFDAGTSHTLGIAAGYNGKWSSSGTKTISYGAGASASGLADVRVINRVNYRDYRNSCGYATQRRPVNISAPLPSGDFTYAGDVNYTASCATYLPGTTAWKSSVRNSTYSGGVQLSVLNVSAQSGWNQATKMQYNVTSKSRICGSTSAGWAASPNSSARAY
jgi:hypothetical protein